MDPHLIYSRYRDDAFATQLTATEYGTFVAMPFRDRFSYKAADVYTEVIQAAATSANKEIERAPGDCKDRRFAKPRRIDDTAQTGRDIGGEIAKAILYAHVVVADLSFANDGVMLEVGAALALKPTQHIVLITQGSASELHFDIKGNVIIEYTRSNGIEKLATAMVAAARDFETRRAGYLTHLSRELTRDAVWLMNWYAKLRTGLAIADGAGNAMVLSLTELLGMIPFLDGIKLENANGLQLTTAMTRYQLAVRDLLAKRLLWTDYRAQTPGPGTDQCANRGTRLGWMFVQHMWPDMTCPADEFSDQAPTSL